MSLAHRAKDQLIPLRRLRAGRWGLSFDTRPNRILNRRVTTFEHSVQGASELLYQRVFAVVRLSEKESVSLHRKSAAGHRSQFLTRRHVQDDKSCFCF